MLAAVSLISCKKGGGEEKEALIEVNIPFVSDFTCDYYDKDGKKIEDKATTFNPEDWLRVKIGFSLSNEAFAAGKRDFTLKFAPTDGFDGKILSANSSATSDKDFTAVYTVDDKRVKNCEIEVRINVSYSSGNLKIAYAYDDDEFSDALSTPLNNDKTFIFTYDEDEDGYILSREVGERKWMNDLEKITFPDSFAGKPVIALGYGVLQWCTGLKSVIIPNGVKSIGLCAFSGCDALNDITIPSSVTNIGQYAFSGCNGLINVYITDMAAWTQIDFPSILEYSNPLCYAKKLYLNGELVTNLIIPDGVTRVKDSAFYGFVGLTSVTIPDCVSNLGESTFKGCSNLQSVNLSNGVQEIGRYAFSECTSLKGIVLPNGVKEIGRCAFSECTSLKGIVLPNGVTSVSDYLFSDCTSLENVNLHDEIKYIGYGAFTGCSSLKTISLPNNLTGMRACAFSRCTSLESITLPSGLKEIQYYTFGNCSSLKVVKFSSSLTSIGRESFSQCSSLAELSFSDVLETIGEKAFNGCTALKTVNFTSGLKRIEQRAFMGCTSLKTVVVPSGLSGVGQEAFKGCNSLEYAKYDNAYYLGNEENPFVAIVNPVNTDIKSIVLNENTKVIGDYAFFNCSGLTSIIIPDGVTSIGAVAFSGTSLSSINIPDSVTYIGRAAFSLTNLTSITIPDSVTNIEEYTFFNCKSLTEVTISGGVTCIG